MVDCDGDEYWWNGDGVVRNVVLNASDDLAKTEWSWGVSGERMIRSYPFSVACDQSRTYLVSRIIESFENGLSSQVTSKDEIHHNISFLYSTTTTNVISPIPFSILPPFSQPLSPPPPPPLNHLPTNLHTPTLDDRLV